jgi:uncharacterized membrane protein
MDKYRVALEAEERAGLERLISAGKAAARKLAHARVLLLADDDIVAALGVAPRTISRVRQRFVTQGFAAALDRKSQPARPAKVKIKGDVEQRLVRLACSDPPEGRCRWTLHLLADEMVALGLARSVSTETVRHALQKTTSGPGSSRPGACPPRPTPSTSGGWKT